MYCKIYFDGESKPARRGGSPNINRTCIVVIKEDDYKVIDTFAGRGDSYDAEWEALILGAKYAVENGFTTVDFFGDHKGIVDFLNAPPVFTGNEKTHAYFRLFCSYAEKLEYTITHVTRRVNLAGMYFDCGEKSQAFTNCLLWQEGIDSH